MREIGDIVREFQRRPGESWALATLVRTWGSSYRPPGARMLIPAQGPPVGSLSGGCLEEEVVTKARQVLRTGQAELMTFDTRRRFGCNGGLEILVEKISGHFLAELSSYWNTRRPCLVSTAYSGASGSRIVDSAPAVDDGELLQQIDPPIRLLLLGDGPDSSPLVDIAGILGWSVKTMNHAGELDETYDVWTAAIVKTHNYGRDFAALRALFSLDLRYIGLMGPRARREQLIGDLLDTGVTPSANLFAPAGLDLGGGTPEAIALAIVAEIQAIFADGSRQSLRDRKAPIHAHPATPLSAPMER